MKWLKQLMCRHNWISIEDSGRTFSDGIVFDRVCTKCHIIDECVRAAIIRAEDEKKEKERIAEALRERSIQDEKLKSDALEAYLSTRTEEETAALLTKPERSRAGIPGKNIYSPIYPSGDRNNIQYCGTCEMYNIGPFSGCSYCGNKL